MRYWFRKFVTCATSRLINLHMSAKGPEINTVGRGVSVYLEGKAWERIMRISAVRG